MAGNWGPTMAKSEKSNDGWADLENDRYDLEHDLREKSPEEIAEDLRRQDLAYDQLRRLPNRTLKASLVLWQRGFTYEEIAELQGYTDATGAKVAIESAVAAAGIGEDDIALVRKKAELTLDIYNQICFDYAVNGGKHIDRGAWIDRGVRVLDRKLRLLGADAPTVIKISPDASELERYAELLARANGAALAEEADPFEMGEIEATVIDAAPEEA